MDPWAPIPGPSLAAVASAEELYTKLMTTSPDLVNDFDKKYDDWKKTLVEDGISPVSTTPASGRESDALVALGPNIVPLIVYRLASGNDSMASENESMAVVLFITLGYLRHQEKSNRLLMLLTDAKLETDFAYQVDHKDISNYNVFLYRCTNLVVDFDTQRT